MKNNNWIPLDERLPELDKNVLLLDEWESNEKKYRDVRVGYLSEYTTRKKAEGFATTCVWEGCEFAFNITHWMELPELP